MVKSNFNTPVIDKNETNFCYLPVLWSHCCGLTATPLEGRAVAVHGKTAVAVVFFIASRGRYRRRYWRPIAVYFMISGRLVASDWRRYNGKPIAVYFMKSGWLIARDWLCYGGAIAVMVLMMVVLVFMVVIDRMRRSRCKGSTVLVHLKAVLGWTIGILRRFQVNVSTWERKTLILKNILVLKNIIFKKLSLKTLFIVLKNIF